MTAPLKILMLEDQPADAELIRFELEEAGFEFELQRVYTEDDYVAHLSPNLDLILSDYTMPQFNAPRALELLNQRNLDIPFIVITATITEDVAVACIKQGAADYLIKDRLARLGEAIRQAIQQQKLQAGRRKVVEALRESEKRYQTLADLSLVGIFRTDMEGRYVYVNKFWCHLTKIPPAEAITTTWTDVIHPEDRKYIYHEWSEGMADNGPYRTECRLLSSEGDVSWVLVQVTSETNDEGEILGYVGTITDITANKKSEKQIVSLLQAEQDRYREAEALRQAALAMVSTIDPDQVIEQILAELQNVVPFDSASVQFLEDGQLRIISGRGFPNLSALKGFTFAVGTNTPNLLVLQKRQPVIVSDVLENYQSCFTTAPHSEGHIRSWLGVPLHIGEKIIGMLTLDKQEPNFYTVVHSQRAMAYAAQAAIALENARLHAETEQEIAERKQVQEALEIERASLAQRVDERTAELKTANAELARASRLKDEFLASMSHELRTPLNAILGMSEVLQDEVYGPLTEKQMKSTQTIKESGQHLLSLINDILDLSKIEAGKLKLNLSSVSIQTVCLTSLQFVKQTAHKKGIKITSHFDEAVKTIEADERRLKQILVNLLSNAVKFTSEGGTITFTVSVSEDGDAVCFAIKDTGIGIAADQMEHLFKPFVQLDSRLARQYSGTGLGLSLVQRLTEMHQGQVLVESEVGRGSCFTVFIPRHLAEDMPNPDINNHHSTCGDKTMSNSSGKLTKILLAEDNRANIETFFDYLSPLGYEITVAQNGLEALNKAKEIFPDLILMDIQMPEMDGLEATRQIRKHKALADTPIIALTALAMPGDKEKCFSAGVNEYLSKPLQLKTLADAIELQLKKKKNGVS